MLPGWCCIANRHIGARERRQLIPHVHFQVPFLGSESQLKSGFACAGLFCSQSTCVSVHRCDRCTCAFTNTAQLRNRNLHETFETLVCPFCLFPGFVFPLEPQIKPTSTCVSVHRRDRCTCTSFSNTAQSRICDSFSRFRFSAWASD